MARDQVVSLEEAYNIATQLCPSILKKLGTPPNKFSEEDIVGQFIEKFIEKNFLAKFNPAVTSFRYYVYMGVRNAAVSAIRHLKYETTSLDAITRPDGEGSSFDFPAPAPVPVQDMIVKGLLEELDDFNFGYGKQVTVTGAEGDEIASLPSTAKSVIKMLFMGFKKPEVAEEFGVTVSTVNNVLNKIKIQVEEKELTPELCISPL